MTFFLCKLVKMVTERTRLHRRFTKLLKLMLVVWENLELARHRYLWAVGSYNRFRLERRRNDVEKLRRLWKRYQRSAISVAQQLERMTNSD